MKIPFTTALIILFAGTFSLAQKSEDLLEAGQRAIERGDFRAAVAHLSEAIESRGNLEEAYLSRAMAWDNLGEYEQALVDYTTVIRMRPDIREAWYARGRIYHRQEKWKLAINDLRKLSSMEGGETNTVYFRSNPGEDGTNSVATMRTLEADVYNYLGDSYCQLGRFDSSSWYFDRAVALSPADASIRINQARCLQEQKQTDAAIRAYERALEVEPENAIAMYNLALLSRNQTAESKEALFSRIINASPGLPQAYEHRALGRFEAGDYKAAEKDYEVAIALDPEDPEKWINFGIIHNKLNNPEQAYRDFTRALELNGDRARIYLNRANTLFSLDEFRAAEADYTLALTYDATYASAYYNRAICRHNQGDTEGACKDLAKAVSLGFEPAQSVMNKLCK